MLRLLERFFESLLWNARLVVVVAVVASLLVSFAIFFIATVEVGYMLLHLLNYPDLPQQERAMLHDETIKHAVRVIDGYLLATVLLIFALGLYELFISRIQQADGSTASRILSIRNLDDLKNRLAKVILMILVVKFFDHAINMKMGGILDMVYFAGGIALIGLALFLAHKAEYGNGKPGHLLRDADGSPSQRGIRPRAEEK